MSDLTVNTKRLDEIYKEWRGNKSCYDNGRPVFEADELLDFAEYCLKHEANEMQAAVFIRPKYYYEKHGLLYIVYSDYDEGFGVVSTENSRWEDELKAKEHCRLLNNVTNE